MMTPTALYSLLVADAPLLALVSTRIYPSQAPQGVTAPYIVWFRIASRPMQTHGEPTQNQFDLVQFSIFASTFTATEAIALALVTALDGVALSTGDIPTLQNRRDGGYISAVNLYRMDADFLI